jgi:SPP1 family predicted phage head-tail adaptor
MQLQASVTHRVMMRYRSDLTPADRLLIRGNPLQIRAIINIEMRDRWLEVACDAGVAT